MSVAAASLVSSLRPPALPDEQKQARPRPAAAAASTLEASIRFFYCVRNDEA